MSRLADEAMYFGAVADGVESQQEEIAALRQQLSDLTAERDKAKAMPMKYRRMEFNAQLQDENESLRQQLAATETRREGVKQQRDTERASYLNEFEKNQVLIKQLADSQKQVTLLRDALEEATALARNLLSDAEQQVVEEYTEAPKVFKICDAALAATEPKP